MRSRQRKIFIFLLVISICAALFYYIKEPEKAKRFFKNVKRPYLISEIKPVRRNVYKTGQEINVYLESNKADEVEINLYKITKKAIKDNLLDLDNVLNIDIEKKLANNFKEELVYSEASKKFRKNVRLTINAPGIYIFEAKTDHLDHITKEAIHISDNMMVLKRTAKNTLLWLTNRMTGEPVEGANIFIYLGNEEIKGNTDKDGIYKLPLELLPGEDPRIAAIFGSDIICNDLEFIDYGIKEITKMYIYTDRPIYRPLQKVNFKGVLRHLSDDIYSLPENKKVKITVIDPKNKKVKDINTALTNYGTFSGSYDIPDEPALGKYKVKVEHSGRKYDSEFTIEEYKKPEYLVSINTKREGCIRGDKIKVDVNGMYYFGAGVPDADVSWNVYVKEYTYPWWIDIDYPWYSKGDLQEKYFNDSLNYHLSSGSAKTDKDGSATFEFETLKDGYDIMYSIIVRVTDKSRKVVEKQTSVIVTKDEFKINVKPDKRYYEVGEKVSLKVTAVAYPKILLSRDIDVKVKIYDIGKLKLSREEYFKKSIKTLSEKELDFDFTTDIPGRYEVAFSATDLCGNEISALRSIYVYDNKSSKAMYQEVELIPDKDIYETGDTAKVLISSSSLDNHALITFEKSKLLGHKIIKIENRNAVIPVKVKQDYNPNVKMTVSIVRNDELIKDERMIIVISKNKLLNIDIAPDKEDYKPGNTASFNIKTTDYKGNPVSSELSFALIDESIYELMRDKNKSIFDFFYSPRDYEMVKTYAIFGNDFKRWNKRMIFKELSPEFGKGRVHNIDVDISLGGNRLVEEVALEYIKGSIQGSKFDSILESLDRPSRKVSPASSKFDSIMYEKGFKKADAFVKGKKGLELDALTLVEPKVRRDFKDTAYYRAHVTTNDEGTVDLEVPLPDNITTWRAAAIAVTKDTKLGEASEKVNVKKGLLVRLEMPRFFTKRDKGTISGIVHNYLDVAKKVKVSLEVAHNSPAPIKINKDAEIWVEVGANSEKRIDWPVDVVASGEAEVTVKALTDEESDAMKLKIPLMTHGMVKYFSDTSIVRGIKTIKFNMPKESIDESAKLRIMLSPRINNITFGSLKYLIGFPYGCVEQTMSRFMPNVLVAKTLQNMGIGYEKEMKDLPKMVDKGLRRLYGFQRHDGGWGWWQRDSSRPSTTAYVLYGLCVARDADYFVDQNVIEKGIKALIYQIKQNRNANSTAYMIYALSKAGAAQNKFLKDLYKKVGEMNNYGLALFAESLYDIGDIEKAKEVISMLLESYDGSSGISSSRTKNQKRYYGWYNSDIETTAYTLKALIKIDPENEIIPELVSWLANQRNGIKWRNTKTTAAAVMALSESFNFFGEGWKDNKVILKVNDNLIGEYRTAKELEDPINVDFSFLRAGENKIQIIIKGKGKGVKLYQSTLLNYYTDEDNIKGSSSGIHIKKTLYKKVGEEWYNFDGNLKVGNEIKVVLEAEGKNAYQYVIIEDPKPAGCDEVIRSYDDEETIESGFAHIEHRDEKVAVFITRMAMGKTYKYEYVLTAQNPGEFHVMPAKAYMMYNDEISGNSEEFTININD